MATGIALSRRAVLRGGSLLLGSGWLHGMADGNPALRFGMVTDVHHADKPEWGTRYYRESLKKLREGVAQFSGSNPAFLVQLGDLVDAAKDPDTERQWLKQAMSALRAVGVQLHSVLGNHCIQTLTKTQFLEESGRERGHYSFDEAGFRFIVLDACYRRDGVSYDAGNFDWKDTDIPRLERQWLRQQLETAPGRVLVFVHQRLDIPGVHTVASAPEVRHILETSGKVAAVFQGHSHQNDYREINRIHYCTMRAVIEGSGVENNGYGVVSVYADGRVAVKGFRAQRDYSIIG
jgi:predicted phosphodiesterase